MGRRFSIPFVLLLTAATACGSTTDTVDPVENLPTTPPATNGLADEAADEPATADTTAPADADVPVDTTAAEGTAITELSPQAIPSLTTLPDSPRATTPGAFPLDPESARVQATVIDLAERLGVAASDVSIVEASAVSWGDSSLGCPQPGMQYLQRVTDGSLVVLNADGVDYRYTGGDPLKLCGNVAGA